MKTQIKHTLTALAVATTLALTACGGGSDSFTITHAPTLAASKMDHTAGQPNFNNEVLAIINGYRATGVDCGGTWMPPVGALKWNDALRIAAMTHAVDLSYAHIGNDGSSPVDRATRAGYTSTYVGENLAWGSGSESPRIAMNWQVNSPSHCKGFMNVNYTETGAAVYSINGGYFVNLFGRP